jgi:hypothetical protein
LTSTTLSALPSELSSSTSKPHDYGVPNPKVIDCESGT